MVKVGNVVMRINNSMVKQYGTVKAIAPVSTTSTNSVSRVCWYEPTANIMYYQWIDTIYIQAVKSPNVIKQHAINVLKADHA